MTETAPGQPVPADIEANAALQRRRVEALCDPARFGPGCERVRLLETHISYVLLTGDHAYKIKKIVRLGFLDFTTLSARRFYCEQELRLNRRLAPSLYLAVVPITESADLPAIDKPGRIVDYAVKMREFPQEALLCNVVGQDALTPGHIDDLAAIVARFHRAIAVAAADGMFGVPDDVLNLALANFAEIRAQDSDAGKREGIDALEAWTRTEHAARREMLAARRRAGFIRECHGDLHLCNIALVDGAVTIFDCIEFNDRMRWIDVMSEIAFTVMDLTYCRRSAYACRFLNGYLEATGDYGGIAVLRFYAVYRAMVRAKVACLRAAQVPPGDGRLAFLREYDDHVRLAGAFAVAQRPAWIITHGFAGCGKTTLSQPLLERVGAIRLRTDVERKRMHGLGASASSNSGIGTALYAPETTRATYEHVSLLARAVVESGFTVLVDGAFLRRWQRDLMRSLAAEMAVPFVIVDIFASEATLRDRVRQRADLRGDASEADIAVLEHQLRTHEPLGPDERIDVVPYDGELPVSHAHCADAWHSVTTRIDAAAAASGDARRGEPAPDRVPESEIAFLSRTESYPEGTTRVACIETHLSWVFLTDNHAYKLKKPACTEHVDLRSVPARWRNSTEEVRLNQRLSSGVYLGAVPLMLDSAGRFTFAPGGAVVDWLVKMRRLPAGRMVDRLIAAGSMRREDVDALVHRLCDFYRQCPPVPVSPAAYREHFAHGIAAYRRELCRPEHALPVAQIEAVSTLQLAFLARADPFDARVRAGRIVEGHGDLRPEHICLEEEPQIIDCLDFSRNLRTLDPADELGFLALECERLGAPQIGAQILDAYRDRSGDAVPEALLHFYRSYRAGARAMLAIRHLDEPALIDRPKWHVQAKRYLDLALAHVQCCAEPPDAPSRLNSPATR